MYAFTRQNVPPSQTAKVASQPASMTTPTVAPSGNAPTTKRIDSLAQLLGAGDGGCFELPLEQLLGNEEIGQLIAFLERPDVQVTVLWLNLSGTVDPQALARLLAVLDARHAALGLRSLPVRVNGREGGDINLALQLELAKSKSALYLGGESVYALICPQVNAPWLLEHLKRFARVGDGPSNPTGWNDKALNLSWQEQQQMWQDAVLVRAVATLSPGGRIDFLAKYPSPEQLQQLEQAKAPFALKLYCVDEDARELSAWLAVPRPQLQALDLSLPPEFGASTVAHFKRQPALRWAKVDMSPVAIIEWTAHPTAPMAAGAVSLTLREGDPTEVLPYMLTLLDPGHLVVKNAGADAAKAFFDGLCAQCPRALRDLSLVWDTGSRALLDKLASLLQGLVLRGLRLEVRGEPDCKPDELIELLLACVPLLQGFEVVDVSRPSAPKTLCAYRATWAQEERQDPSETARMQARAIVAAMHYRVGHGSRFTAQTDSQWMQRLSLKHTGLSSGVYDLLGDEPGLRERFFF